MYAEENGLFFMETSAKIASNVNDLPFTVVCVVYPNIILFAGPERLCVGILNGL